MVEVEKGSEPVRLDVILDWFNELERLRARNAVGRPTPDN
jgi:hypothetical protein